MNIQLKEYDSLISLIDRHRIFVQNNKISILVISKIKSIIKYNI